MIVCSITLSQITWVDGFQVLFARGSQNSKVMWTLPFSIFFLKQVSYSIKQG